MIAISTVVRKRWALLRDIALSVLAAVLLGLILAGLVQGSWEIGWSTSTGTDAGLWLPWVRLSAPIAVFAVASPQLTRPVRRLGWWLAFLAVASVVLLSAARPTVAIVSWLIAILGAAVVHLAFGSSRGRPDIDEVRLVLDGLGLSLNRISPADRQLAGVFVLDALTDDGRSLDVKVCGRDASDTQLLSTIWRTVWFRRAGSPTSPGRLLQVEHEAFLTLLAAQNGVLTEPVVTGLAPNEGAVLVLERVGEAVGSKTGGWDESIGRRVWAMLATLHTARITHGQVDDEHIALHGERTGLFDFRGATVTADVVPRRIDQAQAFVSTVLGVGIDPALQIARESLGDEGLEELLPFIQRPTPSLRHSADNCATSQSTSTT